MVHLSAHLSFSGHALVLPVSLQPLMDILGICLTEVFRQSSIWASPRWSCCIFLWRGCGSLAAWPGAGAAFRLGVLSLGAAACSPLGVSLHSSWLLDGLLCVRPSPLARSLHGQPPFLPGIRVGQNRGWAPGSPQPGCSSRPHWGGSFAARRSPGCRRAGLRNARGQHCWFQWSLAVFSRRVSWRSVKRSCCLAVAFLALTVPAGPRLWARSGRRTQRAALSPQGPRTSPDSLASASAWWSPRE